MGKKEGQGTLEATSFLYMGEFKDDRMHGLGLMKSDSNRTYKGLWKEGKKHGEGVMILPKGHIFTGNWINGSKDK